MTATSRQVHPQYALILPYLELASHSYAGEKIIKDQGETYLPPTSGMRADGYPTVGSVGKDAYDAYVQRSVYPDAYEQCVVSALGVMHRKPPVFQLTPRLEYLRTRATDVGESLATVLRQINAQQLINGRLGLLGDLRVDADGVTQPVIALYKGIAIRNWDDTGAGVESDKLGFVTLDESRNELQPDFTWKFTTRTRVIARALDGQINLSGQGVYSTGVLSDQDTIAGFTYTPVEAQGTTLDVLPFSFINSKDLSPTPEKPPLDGLARLCLAIYRGEADYRQNLFQQGQDTLVIIGAVTDPADSGDGATRTGAGALLEVPTNGDAKYIGVNSQGLPEQRQSLEKDYDRASSRSSQFTEASGGAESGDALRIRVAGKTATLPEIAMAGAAGLEKVLKDMAVWFGENPDDIVVTPNLEFGEKGADGQTLVQLVQSKIQGAPLSDESIHEWMVENGFTSKNYEDELSALEQETPRL